MSDRTYSIQTLADWTFAQTTAAVPATVLHQAQRCVLDVIACAAAGRGHTSVAAVTQACRANFAVGNANVWFGGLRSSPVGAAMINSNAATILDLDDGNRQAMGHPGGAIIPAVLALGQELGAGRAAMLRAIIAGYEIAVRVGAAERRSSYHSANYTGFGVAAAASVLRGMSSAQIAHCLGIVAYYGPRVSDLTLSKEMGSYVKESMPWSVVAGLMSAELACAGFTGNRDAMDIAERFDTPKLLRGLNQSYAIERTYFKRYSCCRWIHSAVEALLRIMHKHELTAAMIDAVEVETFSQACQLNNQTNPDTLVGAQYSVPFCLALASVRGERHLMPMQAECLGDPVVTAFAKKIGVVVSERMNMTFPDKIPAMVSVSVGTQVMTHEIQAPWGEASCAPTNHELIKKFQVVAGDQMPVGYHDTIAREVFSDELSMDTLFEMLREPLSS